MTFKLFHRYQRMVDEGLLQPIPCPNDGARLYTVGLNLKSDDPIPALTCYVCESTIIPGLDALEQMRENLARLN